MRHSSPLLAPATKWFLASALVGAFGCGDNTETTPQGAANSATVGGSTGTGGTGGTQTGTGGAGGLGGAGTGGAGTGGAGGGPLPCLDAASYASLFMVEDAAFCIVALYDAADDLGLEVPTWGRHGGPLTIAPGVDAGSVELTRWTPPSGAMGNLTKQSTVVQTMIPAGSFLGSQAIDLPFFNWTAVSYSGAFPNTQGKVILIKSNAVDTSYDVNSFFEGVGLSAGANQGRLLQTGLSKIGDPSANLNGLYAADTCANAAKPSLLPNGDPSCAAPILVSAWDDASGPIAVDLAGNVFVVMTNFSGDQEARGFQTGTIAKGAPASAGNTVFTMPGFGTTLAAIAPDKSGVGALAFQPWDGTTFMGLDPVVQRYTVTGPVVDAQGTPTPLLKLATAGTSIALMSDDTGRLWAAAPKSGGGTTYAVITRTP